MAVFIGNVAKFHQNLALRDFLASTGTCVPVEASPYDPIWGAVDVALLNAKSSTPSTRTGPTFGSARHG